MSRYLFFIVFALHAEVCVSQQKILLIGTFHKTPDDRLEEITPIAAAVENFRPGIICIEYLIPTDTASIMDRRGDLIFRDMEATRRAWKIPAEDMNAKMESLQRDQNLSSDVLKQMELQQLYFLSSDEGNSDFLGYLIMSSLEKNKDSRKTAWLRETFPGFMDMKATYEFKLGRINRKAYLNNEYYYLVFPLAAKLNISYLYPIDDLSTWKVYEKYYDRLHVPDTMDESKMKFRQYAKDFHQKLQSLPKDSNQWIFANSPQVAQELLDVEGYSINADISSEDVKMLQYYWVQRNRIMAQHIDWI